ncbi:NAD(P)/FAD-dependent oxidoreductase [Leptolyngbya sp. AN02str]|uniref:NAD(P)/FAD-dependent oxidoreductase n=1 Tax=Leptolyngbya sp. AN02str TaxID=3423363 RepID=UPI003D31357B
MSDTIRVLIVGCGVVGATIAYELSRSPQFVVTVVEARSPAQGSTGAALGVLMGAISQKVKGRAWNLRQDSLHRYETLIPELEAITGQSIPYNRQGIVLLRLEEESDPDRWTRLAAIRAQQGWQIDLWDAHELHRHCPQVAPWVPAVYSPGDRQIDPTALTLALVQAATQNGATFHFNCAMSPLPKAHEADPTQLERCDRIVTVAGEIETDWLILTSGIGTSQLTQATPQPLDIRPVLGQAMRIRLADSLGDPTFQPVMTGNDIHLVPLVHGEYWVGATVEFANQEDAIAAQPNKLEEVWQGAIAIWPNLASATRLQTWYGLRPRPFNRPAPVIENFPGYTNVITATGHYRNGVLLAPATAAQVQQLILSR